MLSIGPEGMHRVNGCGSSRGYPGGEEGQEQHEHGYGEEGEWIERADTEKEATQEPRDGEGGTEASDRAHEA